MPSARRPAWAGTRTAPLDDPQPTNMKLSAMNTRSNQADVSARMVLQGRTTAERFTVARWVRTFGICVGLDKRCSDELALAASELVSNVARHAESGWLELSLYDHPRLHVLLVCSDRGPGIADVASARR